MPFFPSQFGFELPHSNGEVAAQYWGAFDRPSGGYTYDLDLPNSVIAPKPADFLNGILNNPQNVHAAANMVDGLMPTSEFMFGLDAPFAVPAFDIPSYPLFVEEEEIFPTYEFFDDLTVDCNSLSCNIRDWS